MARAYAWVFVFFFVLYAGLTRGHFISTDEVLAYQAAESLWNEGVPAVHTTENYGVPGRGGHVYGVVSSGQSIAVVPLFAIGRGAARLLAGTPWERAFSGRRMERNGLVWSGRVEIFFVSLWNAVVTAALCTVFFAFGVRLGLEPRMAAIGTLLLGTASYVAGYASTFFTQPVEALGLLWSFYLLYADRQKPDVRARIGAGVVVALTLAARWPALVIVPGLLGYQAFTAWERRHAGAVAPLLMGVLGGCGLHFLDQLWKFGTIYSQGGYERARWDSSIVTGLAGFLFSPGASIFVYTPLLVLAPVSLVLFARTHRAEAVFVLGQSALYLLIFAAFNNWHGLWCFGPRYTMPITPLLMLALGGWIEARGRRYAPEIAALALAGAWVQLTHFAANFWYVFQDPAYLAVINSYPLEAGSTIPGSFLFVPSMSPLLAQSRATLEMGPAVDVWLVELSRGLGPSVMMAVLIPWLCALWLSGWKAWQTVCGGPAPTWRAVRAAAVLTVLSVAWALAIAALPARVAPRAAFPQSDAVLMDRGVELLRLKNDAAAAIALFCEVIDRNPRHFGANYQLARALEANGQVDAARMQWTIVLALAYESGSRDVEREAREKVVSPR